VKTASALSADATQDTINAFFDTYGTHYTKNAVLGGRFGYFYEFSDNNWMTVNEQILDIKLTAKFNSTAQADMCQLPVPNANTPPLPQLTCDNDPSPKLKLNKALGADANPGINACFSHHEDTQNVLAFDACTTDSIAYVVGGALPSFSNDSSMAQSWAST